MHGAACHIRRGREARALASLRATTAEHVCGMERLSSCREAVLHFLGRRRLVWGWRGWRLASLLSRNLSRAVERWRCGCAASTSISSSSTSILSSCCFFFLRRVANSRARASALSFASCFDVFVATVGDASDGEVLICEMGGVALLSVLVVLVALAAPVDLCFFEEGGVVHRRSHHALALASASLLLGVVVVEEGIIK